MGALHNGLPEAPPEVEGATQHLLAAAAQIHQGALAFPAELAIMRTLLAEAMFEVAMLRARVERLEQRQ